MPIRLARPSLFVAILFGCVAFTLASSEDGCLPFQSFLRNTTNAIQYLTSPSEVLPVNTKCQSTTALDDFHSAVDFLFKTIKGDYYNEIVAAAKQLASTVQVSRGAMITVLEASQMKDAAKVRYE